MSHGHSRQQRASHSHVLFCPQGIREVQALAHQPRAVILDTSPPQSHIPTWAKEPQLHTSSRSIPGRTAGRKGPVAQHCHLQQTEGYLAPTSV